MAEPQYPRPSYATEVGRAARMMNPAPVVGRNLALAKLEEEKKKREEERKKRELLRQYVESLPEPEPIEARDFLSRAMRSAGTSYAGQVARAGQLMNPAPVTGERISREISLEPRSLEEAIVLNAAGLTYRRSPYAKAQLGVGKRLPFVGHAVSAIDALETISALDRLDKGTASSDDYDRIADTLNASWRAGKKNYFQNVAEGASYLPSYMIEFLATGPVYAAVKKGSTKATARALEKVSEKLAEKHAAKAAMAVGSRLAGAAAQATAMGMTPQMAAERALRQRLSTGKIDWSTAGAQGLLEGTIEAATERLGEKFVKLPMPKKLIAARKAWERLAATNPELNKILKDAAFHGFLPEMGEEVAAKAARVATGLDAVPSFKQLVNEMGVTAGVIAAVPAGQAVLATPGAVQRARLRQRALQNWKEGLSAEEAIIFSGMTKQDRQRAFQLEEMAPELAKGMLKESDDTSLAESLVQAGATRKAFEDAGLPRGTMPFRKAFIDTLRTELEKINAGEDREAAAVHGNVLDQERPQEGPRQVPADQGGERIPQEEKVAPTERPQTPPAEPEVTEKEPEPEAGRTPEAAPEMAPETPLHQAWTELRGYMGEGNPEAVVQSLMGMDERDVQGILDLEQADSPLSRLAKFVLDQRRKKPKRAPAAPEEKAAFAEPAPAAAKTGEPEATPATTAQEEKEQERQKDESVRATIGSDRPQISTLGQLGRTGRLVLADGNTYNVQYAIVGADHVTPSHDARRAFARNPEGDRNERPYHDPVQGAASRAIVEKIADADPQKIPLLVSDTLSPVDGPPIVTNRGIVLGGNARAMAIQLAYARGGEAAQRMRDAIIGAADHFGISAEDAKQIEHPVLIRILTEVEDGSGLSRILNEALTAGKTQATEAVSRGEHITPELAETVSSYFEPDESGETPTLGKVLSTPRKAKRIIESMTRSGALTQRDADRMTDPETGLPNAEGKQVIEQSLLGRLLGDPVVLGNASPGTKQKLLAAVGPLVRGIDDPTFGPRLSEAIRAAVEALPGFQASDSTLNDYFMRQVTPVPMPGQGDAAAAALADALVNLGARKFRGATDEVVSALGIQTGGKQKSSVKEEESAKSVEEAIARAIPSSAAKLGLTPGNAPTFVARYRTRQLVRRIGRPSAAPAAGATTVAPETEPSKTPPVTEAAEAPTRPATAVAEEPPGPRISIDQAGTEVAEAMDDTYSLIRRSLASRSNLNVADAEDIAQNVNLAMLENRRPENVPFNQWRGKIIANRIADYYRKKGRQREVQVETMPEVSAEEPTPTVREVPAGADVTARHFAKLPKTATWTKKPPKAKLTKSELWAIRHVGNGLELTSAATQEPYTSIQLLDADEIKSLPKMKQKAMLSLLDPDRGLLRIVDTGEAQYIIPASEAIAQAARPKTAQMRGGPVGRPTEPGMPIDMEGTGEKLGASAVLNTLQRDFGVDIEYGRLHGKMLRGQYSYIWQRARAKRGEEASLDVASHELAHGIDDRTDLLSSANDALKQEIAQLDYDDSLQRPREGFAEFVRGYLTGDIDVETASPDFYRHFQQWLNKRENKRWRKAFESALDVITRWRRAGAVGRIAGQIYDIDQRPTEPISDSIIRASDWTYQKLKNQAHFGMMFEKQLRERGYSPKPGESFMDIYWGLMQSGSQLALRALQNGVFLMGPDMNTIGKPLFPALEKIADRYDTWVVWAYARHALESMDTGKPEAISRDDAQYVYDKYKDEPGFEEAADALTQANNDALDMLVDVGQLSEQTAQVMKEYYKTYLPLHRVAQKRNWRKRTAGPSLVDIPDPIKRRFGHGGAIVDPVQSTVARFIRFYNQAIEASVLHEMLKSAEAYGAGGWMEIVSPKLRITRTTLPEIWPQIKPQMEDAGISREAIEELADRAGDISDLISIYRPDYWSNRNEPAARILVKETVVRPDGTETTVATPKILYFKHPELYSVIKSIEYWALPKVIDMTFGNIARMLRLGATTIKATFLATNAVNDAPTYLMQRRAGGVFDPAPALVAYVGSEVANRIGMKENPFVQLHREFGGRLSNVLSQDRPSVRKATRLAVKGRLRHSWVEAAFDGIAASEMAYRIAEFAATLRRRGYTKAKLAEMLERGELPPRHVMMEALKNGHEVTVDFRRMGEWGVAINRLATFFNARLEGIDKLIRTSKNRPATAMVRAIPYIIIPSLIYWWRNKDEDWYKEKAAWFNRFWVITNDDGHPVHRIPRGHDWGTIGAGVESLLQSMYDANPEAMTEWVTSTLQSTWASPMPTGAVTIYEGLSGRDTFRNAPIESPAMQQIAPEERAYPWTSTTVKAAAKWLAEITGKRVRLSPVWIEHMIDRSLGGAFREYVVPAEKLAAGKRVPLADVPIARGFTLRKDYAKSVSEFYEQQKEIEMEYNTARHKGEEPPAELTVQHGVMRRHKDLMAKIRNASILEENEKTMRRLDGYRVAVARLAVGKRGLHIYPNPYTDRSAPRVIAEARNGALAAAAYTVAKVQRDADVPDEALAYLKSTGASEQQIVKSLADHLRQQALERHQGMSYVPNWLGRLRRRLRGKMRRR